MLDFSNKVFLITGAATGIGLATTRYVMQYGAKVVMADMNLDGLQKEAAAIDPTGKMAIPRKLDVSSSANCDALLKEMKDSLGGLDHVVHCAGIYPRGTIEEMTDDDWRKLMAVNLDGTFYLCRAALPVMRDGGSFVLSASVAGHRGSFARSAYAASKGAVLAFMHSLAIEAGPRNIRANCVSPGTIVTGMTIGLIQERRESMLAATPLGRFGEPEETASVIAFLSSPMASFVSGETIHVNGGMYMD